MSETSTTPDLGTLRNAALIAALSSVPTAAYDIYGDGGAFCLLQKLGIYTLPPSVSVDLWSELCDSDGETPSAPDAAKTLWHMMTRAGVDTHGVLTNGLEEDSKLARAFIEGLPKLPREWAWDGPRRPTTGRTWEDVLGRWRESGDPVPSAQYATPSTGHNSKLFLNPQTYTAQMSETSTTPDLATRRAVLDNAVSSLLLATHKICCSDNGLYWSVNSDDDSTAQGGSNDIWLKFHTVDDGSTRAMWDKLARFGVHTAGVHKHNLLEDKELAIWFCLSLKRLPGGTEYVDELGYTHVVHPKKVLEDWV